VAGEEGDPPAGHGADGDGRRGGAVGRVDADRLRVGQELVEPRSAEDPHLGRRGIAHAGELLLALVALSEELDLDELSLDELDELDVLDVEEESDDELEEPLSELDDEPFEEADDEPFFELFIDPRLSVL
jgi:hypothetical protein